jgi:hypothetical protein
MRTSEIAAKSAIKYISSFLVFSVLIVTSHSFSHAQEKKNFARVTRTAPSKNAKNSPAAPAGDALKNTADLTPLVRDVLQHELSAQAADDSLWCYRKLQEKDGKQELFAACQTRVAEINRLLAVNDKPLDEKARKAEDQRIAKLLKNREQLRKQKQQMQEDGKQATNMLKMIPDAFLFQQESKDGDRIKLRFVPNDEFHPSGYSASVFHHMEGTLTLDLKQKRLAEISGRLNSEVKFGGGFLGHLDKGGTFYVMQQDVGSGFWEVTTMDVRMNGKALLFKTIAVRTREVDTDFHPVPQTVTVEQAAAMTDSEGSTTMASAQK